LGKKKNIASQTEFWYTMQEDEEIFGEQKHVILCYPALPFDLRYGTIIDQTIHHCH